MIKKIAILMLLISISLSSFAFDKASNGYAKGAEHIILAATGYKRDNTSDIEEEVAVDILGFKGTKWAISIEAEEGTVFSGILTLDKADDNDEGLLFFGEGVNDETGETVRFVLNSEDDAVYIVFYAIGQDDIPDMIYNTFCVKETNPEAFIIFNKTDTYTPITDPNWKKGTTKQLKSCLSQNKYLKLHTR